MWTGRWGRVEGDCREGGEVDCGGEEGGVGLSRGRESRVRVSRGGWGGRGVGFLLCIHTEGKLSSYSAVPNPQDCSKRFTLDFPHRPVQINSGWHPAMLQLMCEGCLYNYLPLSIVRYSFIQLNELEQYKVNELAHSFKREQDSNPGPVSLEFEALPVSHCTLHILYTHQTTFRLNLHSLSLSSLLHL